MPVIKSHVLPNGNLEGASYGATTSLIIDHSEPGHGPRLHRHPYDETWFVEQGNVTFQAGQDRLQAGPGDVVIVPGGVPHKFINDGPGTSRLVCVHASPKFITEWLE